MASGNASCTNAKHPFFLELSVFWSNGGAFLRTLQPVQVVELSSSTDVFCLDDHQQAPSANTDRLVHMKLPPPMRLSDLESVDSQRIKRSPHEQLILAIAMYLPIVASLGGMVGWQLAEGIQYAVKTSILLIASTVPYNWLSAHFGGNLAQFPMEDHSKCE
ncbi:hypothetical protein EGR_09797 [Echinococcus granulosus]|uniref:Uncharacterized protein n=1 Tax=Echinococcus granulosus TaxID=6210 RepID=W6U2L7_ECHGR|nr:hypothetical protein EGR_09797 [Echinococcus granulosus]EUB55360.1 hypothetical protein EGR_09797 [Echinococcus granulosus]